MPPPNLTLLTFLQDGPIPMALVSAEGIVTLVSQSFEQATGLVAGEKAPDWMGGDAASNRAITLGDRHYTLWTHAFRDGRLVVLRDRTELRVAQDRIWEQKLHLSKVYAELAVRDRMLGTVMDRMAHDGSSGTLGQQIQVDQKVREREAILARHLGPDQARELAASVDLGSHKSVVTIVAADIVGAEEALGELESEELFDLFAEYRNDVRQRVAEQGGTVEEVSAFRARAFFGDPLAAEDHAERAVRAALRLRAHVKQMEPRWFPTARDVDVAIGIHTGYATVGLIGGMPAGHYAAVGKTVTLALGLLERAAPGQILLSGRTYDAVRDRYHTRDVSIVPRGARSPITAYELLGEKTLAEPALPLTAPTDDRKRLGPYVVLETLGEGGMATVYRGLDEGLNRHVALKVLRGASAQDEKFVTRLRREARGLAKLNSPYVAQIYSIGADPDPPYFAMELIDGRTLRETIQKEGFMAVPRALGLMTEAALGLEAAAEQGIIHRDIKPDNIMVTARGQVKLMDFGLVKRADDESGVTAHGLIIGTPRYMSPEQARCEAVDYRSDIYSLGATFFHAIVGRAPFDGDSALAIMRKHEIAPVPTLQSLPRPIPPDVYGILARMLAKRPDDRFQSYGTLIEAIAAVR
ncbi:MAG: protein kinase [Acidobacteriota bacterium]